MEPSIIRALGNGISALGALTLALRIKGLVDIIALAIKAHDINDRVLIEILNGGKQRAPMLLGMDEQVEKKQKHAVILLIVGFSFIVVGNAINVFGVLLK